MLIELIHRSEKPKLSYDDLSLSQLDPEVMAALPADILNEVESHFKKKPSPVKTAFDDMRNSARVRFLQFRFKFSFSILEVVLKHTM